MCGIAGFSGAFEPSLLERMGRSLAHRGPDDAGSCFVPEARVGLAHRRLSIIDLSPGGHQPRWSADGRAAITYNGEIYNYRELREELVGEGFAFHSQSDTEVLLQLYLRDGEDLLARLNGIFAFAIWDARRGVLFAARDQLGVKPLYYAETPRGFLFASELKALLEWPGLDRGLDLHALDCHLHYMWSPSPLTLLRSVRKLEPGSALRVRDGRLERRWSFYELPYHQPIEPVAPAAAAEAVRQQLATAVRRQMVADVPVGAFLSGGLDSSSVVAFAREAAGDHKLRCFTIGFTDPEARREGMAEDLPHAQRVAEHLGVQLDTVWVGPEMVDELPRMIFHSDEPAADPATINALLICRLAREHGMKVLLAGAGGDDIFTGYRRHTALLQERYWSWLPPSARRLLASGARRLPVRSELLRRLAKAFQFADLDGDARLASYLDFAPPELPATLYAEETRAALAGEPAERLLLQALERLPAHTPRLNRLLYLDARFYLTDHNLNYMDKMAMASGVEVRVPILDPDLVALAARLPPELKQRGTTGKWIFRKAMEPLLPREVIYRRKVGFGAPLRHWIRHPLRPLVDDVLSEASLRRRGLFDARRVRGMIERDRNRRLDAAYPIFALICVELWCRMFVDPPAPTLRWDG